MNLKRTSPKKEDHKRNGVRIDFCDFISLLVLVSIDKTYQPLKTIFDHISKHLEIRRFPRSLEMWQIKHGLLFLIYYMMTNSCQL